MCQTGFTQIIDGCPHKVSNQIGVLVNQIPVLCRFLGNRFAAVHHSFGKTCVIFLVFFPLIVVAGNVEIAECSFRVFFPAEMSSVPKCVDCGGGAGSVIFFNGCDEFLCNHFSSRFVCTFGYFITDAPHDNGWMVSVSAEHGCHVMFAPFVEILVIILRTFGLLPLVEYFVNNK